MLGRLGLGGAVSSLQQTPPYPGTWHFPHRVTFSLLGRRLLPPELHHPCASVVGLQSHAGAWQARLQEPEGPLEVGAQGAALTSPDPSAIPTALVHEAPGLGHVSNLVLPPGNPRHDRSQRGDARITEPTPGHRRAGHVGNPWIHLGPGAGDVGSVRGGGKARRAGGGSSVQGPGVPHAISRHPQTSGVLVIVGCLGLSSPSRCWDSQTSQLPPWCYRYRRSHF